MVFGVVKRSEGYIWIYSEPGQGTTFKIYIPFVHDAIEVAVEDELLVEGGSETILVVEDEEEVRGFAVEVLNKNGYQVIAAPDGPATLDLLGRSPDIDLLLTDVVMSGMGGRELAEEVQKQRPGITVLYISGYPEEAIVGHKVFGRGVQLLEKPFGPTKLLRHVRQILDAAASLGADESTE